MAQRHVLVIDDSATVRYLFAEIIENYDVRLSEAASAEDGLRILAQDKVDLLFLDIHLPGLDGLELLKELRKTDKSHACKVVMISSDRDQAAVDLATQMGADDYLPKHVSVGRIVDMLQKHLGIK